MNEGWHNALKVALTLGKNQKSWYSLAGVTITFEACSRQVDHRYLRAQNQWRNRHLSLVAAQLWLKLFPYPIQRILADNFRVAQNSQIGALDHNNECDCVTFRK